MTLVSEEIKKASTVKKHFADAIVFNIDGKILILLRGKDTNFHPGKWCLPGGHVDANETSDQACVRELEEETNLKALSCTKCHSFENDQVCIDYYLCDIKQYDINEMQVILENKEHFNFKWIDKHELCDYDFIPGLKEELEKILFPKEVIVKAIDDIKLAFDQGLVKEDILFNALEKGGKIGMVGEIRTWGDKRYVKTNSGWIIVKENKDRTVNGKIKKKKLQEFSQEELKHHAKNSSKSQLDKIISEHKSPVIRKHAHDELKRREIEEAGIEENKPIKKNSQMIKKSIITNIRNYFKNLLGWDNNLDKPTKLKEEEIEQAWNTIKKAFDDGILSSDAFQNAYENYTKIKRNEQ